MVDIGVKITGRITQVLICGYGIGCGHGMNYEVNVTTGVPRGASTNIHFFKPLLPQLNWKLYRQLLQHEVETAACYSLDSLVQMPAASAPGIELTCRPICQWRSGERLECEVLVSVAMRVQVRVIARGKRRARSEFFLRVCLLTW